MNEDWRYSPERLDERRFCLAALILHKVPIGRKAYEFCHDFTSQGMCRGILDEYRGNAADPAAFKAVYETYLSWLHETNQEGPDYELTPLEGVDKVG